jgi:hypothetical protein
MYTLRIKITKEIMNKAIFCGLPLHTKVDENCAFAVALREIFPKAAVATEKAWLYGRSMDGMLWPQRRSGLIDLPPAMSDFIRKFDFTTLGERVMMIGQEFDLELPDCIIDNINIDEIQEVLKNTPHLELVNNSSLVPQG